MFWLHFLIYVEMTRHLIDRLVCEHLFASCGSTRVFHALQYSFDMWIELICQFSSSAVDQAINLSGVVFVLVNLLLELFETLLAKHLAAVLEHAIINISLIFEKSTFKEVLGVDLWLEGGWFGANFDDVFLCVFVNIFIEVCVLIKFFSWVTAFIKVCH